MASYTISPDGAPGDTAGFGSARAARDAMISAVRDRQGAPGRAAEPGERWRYLPQPGVCWDSGQRRARSLPLGRRSHQMRQEGFCRHPSKLLINNHPGGGMGEGCSYRHAWDSSWELRPDAVSSQRQSVREKHRNPRALAHLLRPLFKPAERKASPAARSLLAASPPLCSCGNQGNATNVYLPLGRPNPLSSR